MAGRAVREKGLRAAALPGRVAAAYSMTLDAGPRAHERNIGGFIVGPPGHQAL